MILSNSSVFGEYKALSYVLSALALTGVFYAEGLTVGGFHR